MTNKEAVEWIEILIAEMKRDTSGHGADPEYKDEVYEALSLAIAYLQLPNIHSVTLNSDKIVPDVLNGWKYTGEILT